METDCRPIFLVKLRQNVDNRKILRYHLSQSKIKRIKQLFLRWRHYKPVVGLNYTDIKKIQYQKLVLYFHILNNKCKRRRYIRSLYYLAQNVHSIYRYKSSFFNWFKFLLNQNKVNSISKGTMIKQIKGKRYAYCSAIKRGLEKLKFFNLRRKANFTKYSIGLNFHLLLHKRLYQRDFVNQLKLFYDRSIYYKKDMKKVTRYYRQKIKLQYLNRWICYTTNRCDSRIQYLRLIKSKNIATITYKQLNLFFEKWISYEYSRIRQVKVNALLSLKSDKYRIRYPKLQAFRKLVRNNPLNGEKIRFIEYFRYRNITLPIYIRSSFNKLITYFRNKIDRNKKFRLKCNKLLLLYGKNILDEFKMKTQRAHTLSKYRKDLHKAAIQYLRYYFDYFRNNLVSRRVRRDIVTTGHHHYVRIKLQLFMKKRWRWVMKTKALILYDKMLMRKVFLGLKLYTKESMELVELGKLHMRKNAFPLILSRFKSVRIGKKRSRKTVKLGVLYRSKYLYTRYFRVWRRCFKTCTLNSRKLTLGKLYFREIYISWALNVWVKSHMRRSVSKDEISAFKRQLVMHSFNIWMKRAAVNKYRARRNRGYRVLSKVTAKVTSSTLKVMPFRGDFRLINQLYAIRATTSHYLYNNLARPVFHVLLRSYRTGRKHAKIFKYVTEKLKSSSLAKIYRRMKYERQQHRLRNLSEMLFKKKRCSKALKELLINSKIEVRSKLVKLIILKRYFNTYCRTCNHVRLMKRTINLMLHDYKINLLTSAFNEWKHETLCERNIVLYTRNIYRTFKLSNSLITWYFNNRRRIANRTKQEMYIKKLKHFSNKAKVIHKIMRYIEKKYAFKDKMVAMSKYYNNYTCRSVLLNLLFFRRKRIADEHYKKLASARFIKMLQLFTIKSIKEKREVQKALNKLKHFHFLRFVKLGTSHTKSNINIRKIIVQYGKLKYKGNKLKIYDYSIKSKRNVYAFLDIQYTNSVFSNNYKKLYTRLLRRSKYRKMYEYCRQLHYLRQVKVAFKLLLFNRRSRRQSRFLCDVMSNHNKKRILIKCVRKLDLFVCDRFGMSEVIRSMSTYHSNKLFQKRGLKALKLNMLK